MKHFSDYRGFTLIELVVVIAILAIMSVIALPKISGLLGDNRKSSAIISAYITAVTDDAFINRKTNYLCIHLSHSGDKKQDLFGDSFVKSNSINVYEFTGGKFLENQSTVLKFRDFGSSVFIDKVILDGNKVVSEGNVLIPFYSDGSSENFEIRLNSDNEIIKIAKNRNIKTPQIKNDN